MKKKLFLMMILILLPFTMLITACGNSEDDNFTFKKAEIKDEKYCYTVSNETEEVSFLNEISVAKGYSWSVAKDEYGVTTFTTKTVPLSVGDNTFYIIVMDKNENSTIYEVCIRRRPTYVVSFNTCGGSNIISQVIEEGNLSIKPDNPTKTGYSFDFWDFDFSTPIYGNKTITANWIPNRYQINCYSDEKLIESYDVFYNESFILSIPEKKGHSFTGWFEDMQQTIKVADSNGNSLSNYIYTENKSFYAGFTVNKYQVNVNYESNHGDVSGVGQYDYSTTANLSITKINNGYKFIGWFVENRCISVLPQYSFIVEDNTYNIEARWGIDIDGEGTQQNPYKIKTKNNYYALYLIDTTTEAYYELLTDLSFAGESYTPLNISNGYFNGNNHIVSYYNISKDNTYNGFFGVLENVELTNLNITNFRINYEQTSSQSYAGGIAGKFSGRLSNCNVTGTIRDNTVFDVYRDKGNQSYIAYIGGVVGSCNGNLQKVSSNTNISFYINEGYQSTHNTTTYIGGIIGRLYGNLESSYSIGSILVETDLYYSALYNGGIVGLLDSAVSNIKNCYSTTTVESTGSNTGIVCSGGIAGRVNGGLIECCYSAGNIVSQERCDAYAGGIIGYTGGIIKDCFAIGNITALSNSSGSTVFCGAIANEDVVIENSYRYSGQVLKAEKAGNNISCNLTGLRCTSINEIISNVKSSWNTSIWNFIDDGLPTISIQKKSR